MQYLYNFGAGPAIIPQEVLGQVQKALLNWQDTGLSILEVGHRTQKFLDLIDGIHYKLKNLLKIPDSHKIMLMGLPARSQFSMIPINFLEARQKALYYNTGYWSNMAYEIAAKCNDVEQIYEIDSIKTFKKTSQIYNYIYYTPNETLEGFRIDSPVSSYNNLITDMTSCFMTEPIDFAQHAMVFSGTQKNLGASGVTIAIISEEFLLRNYKKNLPEFLDYKSYIDNNSLFATPPMISYYIIDLMLEWIYKNAGVEAMHINKQNKASMLYEAIDKSFLYNNNIKKENRSLLNIYFTLKNPHLQDKFILEATSNGFYGLQGHRAKGGIRASIYNAMPVEFVVKLIDFMQDFEQKNA